MSGKIEELLNSVFLTLQKPNISQKKANVDNTFNTKKDYLKQVSAVVKGTEQGKKHLLHAQILSQQKTCLTDL
jgi:hypothetical protein